MGPLQPYHGTTSFLYIHCPPPVIPMSIFWACSSPAWYMAFGKLWAHLATTYDFGPAHTHIALHVVLSPSASVSKVELFGWTNPDLLNWGCNSLEFQVTLCQGINECLATLLGTASQEEMVCCYGLVVVPFLMGKDHRFESIQDVAKSINFPGI
jgi:hypothetical protein